MSESRTRRRKRRKVFGKSYDEDELDDAVVNAELRAFGFFVEDETEDEAERWGYDLQTKIECDRFDENSDQLIEKLEGKDYNVQYFHERGFKKPIYFRKPDGLGLLVPSAENFTVQDVKKLVGASRIIDVVDVKTQKGSQMSLRDFVDYFQRPNREKLLNVLSLEFSKTKLADYVRAPAAVRSLDWVELAWPEELRNQQVDSTNALNSMKYPKVQNYCLMSVGNCYTDFHVDFGGTSVWYHVLRGEKIFWLIPPTEENCQHFQAWTLSGKQHKTFFGDLVEQCVRVKLKAGDTFMIPSGWFHAVYTPIDSLVFGGNFLHSFAIPMQLSVYEIERNTHVPVKFRYPFFMEMQWYVLERYYSILTGRTFLRQPPTATSSESGHESSTSNTESVDHETDEDKIIVENASQLTDSELEGLHALINWLQSLSTSKRRVPDLIEKPDLLLRKFRDLLPMLNSIQRQPSSKYFSILSIGRSPEKQEPQPRLSSEQRQHQQHPSQIPMARVYKRVKLEEQVDLKPTTSSPSPQCPPINAIHSYAAATTPTSAASGSPNLMPETATTTTGPTSLPSWNVVSPVQQVWIVQRPMIAINHYQQHQNQRIEPFVIVPRESVPIVGAECTIEATMEPGFQQFS